MITMKVPNRYRKISKKRFNHAGKAFLPISSVFYCKGAVCVCQERREEMFTYTEQADTVHG